MRGLFAFFWLSMTSRRLPLTPIHKVSLYNPDEEVRMQRSWKFLPKTDPVVFTHTQFLTQTRLLTVWSTQKGNLAVHSIDHSDPNDHSGPSDPNNKNNKSDPSDLPLPWYGRVPPSTSIERCWATTCARLFFILLDYKSWTRDLWEMKDGEWTHCSSISGLPILCRSDGSMTLWTLEAGGILTQTNLTNVPNLNIIRQFHTSSVILSADVKSRMLVFVDGSSTFFVSHLPMIPSPDKDIRILEVPTNETTREWVHVGLERVHLDLIESRWCVICLVHSTNREGHVSFWRFEFYCSAGLPGKNVDSLRSAQCLFTVRTRTPISREIVSTQGGRCWLTQTSETTPLRAFVKESTLSIVGYTPNDRDWVRIPVHGHKSIAVQWSDHTVWFWDLDEKLLQALRSNTQLRRYEEEWMEWWTCRNMTTKIK